MGFAMGLGQLSFICIFHFSCSIWNLFKHHRQQEFISFLFLFLTSSLLFYFSFDRRPIAIDSFLFSFSIFHHYRCLFYPVYLYTFRQNAVLPSFLIIMVSSYDFSMYGVFEKPQEETQRERKSAPPWCLRVKGSLSMIPSLFFLALIIQNRHISTFFQDVLVSKLKILVSKIKI